MNKKQWLVGTMIQALLLSVAATAQAVANDVAKPTQPPKPHHGPGSSEVSSHSVMRVKIGEGGQGGWIFCHQTPPQAMHPSSSCAMDGLPSFHADIRRGSIILSCGETSFCGPTTRTTY